MHLRPVVVGGTRPSDSPQDGANTSKGLTRPVGDGDGSAVKDSLASGLKVPYGLTGALVVSAGPGFTRPTR